MERSMYSLILTDDVVAAIDLLARQQGTSRSNYINQILAEHVSFVTPEQQMRQVFSYVTQQMDEAFRVQEQGSDAMLSIFGTLRYKYRPTVRYSVELLRSQTGQEAGFLKISCRTQSATLLQAMQYFFHFWIQLEQRHNPNGAFAQGLFDLANHRLTCTLLRGDVTDDAAFGTAVGNYIRMFHCVLQSYFTGLQQELPMPVLQHTLEQQYEAVRKKLYGR